jgi:hypothetical protein
VGLRSCDLLPTKTSLRQSFHVCFVIGWGLSGRVIGCALVWACFWTVKVIFTLEIHLGKAYTNECPYHICANIVFKRGIGVTQKGDSGLGMLTICY